MLSSMTAYGRASIISSFGRLIAEIQSVNRRFLEISVSLPKELTHFEMDIRRWIGQAVGRGQIIVKVEALFEADVPLRAKPNLPLARHLKQAWTEISQAVGSEMSPASLFQILAQEETLVRFEPDLTDETLYRSALHNAISDALEGFLTMRRQEGQALMADIAVRLELLRDGVERISLRTPQAADKYRERLVARLEQLLPGSVENEERILREICLYADRIDITEELTRFKSHLQQFDDTMRSGKPSVGKTLDFLLQELLREANTIGSKAMASEVAQDVVELKAELERIREQLQNVE